jgi:type III restriction enzyme
MQTPDSEMIQDVIPEPDEVFSSADEIDIDTEALKSRIDTTDEMLSDALIQAAQYDDRTQTIDDPDYDAAPQEVRMHMNVYKVCEEHAEYVSSLRLPQFVIPMHLPMFEDSGTTLLTREALAEGFVLRDKDTMIDFSTVESEIARVDIAESNAAVPKAWKLTGVDNQFFREYFNSQPHAKRVSFCKGVILNQLSKINAINDKDLEDYVSRIIDSLTSQQLEDMQHSPHVYIAKIKRKIDQLIDAHRERKFELWTEQGKITCEPMYNLKTSISPLNVTTTLPKTLYSAEEEMNGLEYDVAWELANLPNIRWWHRNIARSGFCIR